MVVNGDEAAPCAKNTRKTSSTREPRCKLAQSKRVARRNRLDW